MNQLKTGEVSEAAQAASDLEKELAEVLRQRAAISAVLRAIASSPHDLQPIFDTIVESARGLFGADMGVFRLVEEAGFRLVARAVSPAVSDEALPPKLVERGAFHGSFYERLMASKSPLHVPDVAALDPDRAGVALASIIQRGLRTLLYVPMLRKGELVGSLALARRRVEHFTEKEIELLADFAAQATIALESTRSGNIARCRWRWRTRTALPRLGNSQPPSRMNSTSLSLLWRPMEAPPCGGSRDSLPASTKQEALSST
jgi:GAF domain-containing protein